MASALLKDQGLAFAFHELYEDWWVEAQLHSICQNLKNSARFLFKMLSILRFEEIKISRGFNCVSFLGSYGKRRLWVSLTNGKLKKRGNKSHFSSSKLEAWDATFIRGCVSTSRAAQNCAGCPAASRLFDFDCQEDLDSLLHIEYSKPPEETSKYYLIDSPSGALLTPWWLNMTDNPLAAFK